MTMPPASPPSPPSSSSVLRGSPRVAPSRPRGTPRTIASALVALLVAAIAVATGCGEDARATDAESSPTTPPPRPVGPAEDDEPASSTGPGLPKIDVDGRVADDRDAPVVGRSLVVVDRRGRRTELMTDEEGSFHVPGVAPPYDVMVAPAPSGAIITPLVFLGVHRGDPRLEVFERQGPLARPASQTMKVGVRLPACPAARGACWVRVVTTSAGGRGANALSYVEGATYSVVEVDHAWTAETVEPGEAVEVHVLVGRSDYEEYAYARSRALPARPGETTDAGIVSPARVETTARVDVSTHAAKLPDGWEWTLSTMLDLPGGASFSLLYEIAPAATLRLPKLPGGTFRVGAWAQHPSREDHPYFHRSAQAWSGALPLSVPNVALDVPIGPDTVRPTLEGNLSRRGLGPAWDDTVPGLYTLAIVDLVRGRQAVRAFTSQPEIALSRLEALGLRELDPGSHVLDLTTRLGADVDELVQPDARLRRRRFDDAAPGAMTYQRFRFMVTP